MVCGDGAHAARAWLTSVEGVEGTAPFHAADTDLECCLVWSEPGRVFGFAEMPTELGTHGGPRTRTQVAVVTGGHPLVEPLAGAVATTRVGAADWAPTIATLLGVGLPRASGRALL